MPEDYVFTGIDKFINDACDEAGVEYEYKTQACRGWHVQSMGNALSQVSAQKAMIERGEVPASVSDEVWDRCRAIIESVRAQLSGLTKAFDDVLHGIDYTHEHPTPPDPPPPETVRGGAGRDAIEDEDEDKPLARRRR